MNQEGSDLLRIALSNYSGSGSTARLEDSVSAADKIREGIKKSGDSKSGRSKNVSALNSRNNSREPKKPVSKVHSRIQSRANSSERSEKNSSNSKHDKYDKYDNNDHYDDNDNELDELADSASNLNIDDEDSEANYKKKNAYSEQLGRFSQTQLVDALNSLLDKMTEKRAEKREEGLQGVASIMAHKYIGDFEEKNKESYLESFKKSLKIQKTLKEALLATRGIALWFLQFGHDEDTTYNDIYNYLYKIMIETDSAPLKAQIIHTIAFSNFIGSNDYVDAVKVIEILSKQIRDWKSEELTLLATSSYGLMMTVVADANIDLAIELFEKDYESHLNMLGSQSVNVRIKSAENLALMYELISEHDEDFEFDNHMEVIEMLEQMSKDSTKKHSKRDKSTQKAALRQVVNSIANNQSPQIRLSLQSQYVTFSTWKDIIKLEAFKFTVMNGMYMHFLENPLMEMVFEKNIGLSDAQNESNDTERIVVDSRSELAKYRSISKNVMRQARSKYNRQLDDDDDDY